MRRFALPLAFLTGIYLDSILFCRLNIGGIRPDALLVVIVSAGVLLGSVKAGIMGVGIGLFMDVLFGPCIGLNAIAYMVAGVTGGLFYQKFYADNVVVPAMVAAVSALCAFLNSLSPLPSARPASGSLPGPKTMSPTMRMRMSSGNPMPNIS